jgi:hypothetical protein
MANPNYGEVALGTALPIFEQLKALLPSQGALEDLLRQDSSSALRGATARDQESLQRAGLGRSVAGAFSPGTRSLQFARALANEPSAFSKFLGGALGLASGALLPGLIGGKDPLQALLMQILGQGGGSGDSFAGSTSNLQFPSLTLPTGTF